MYNPEKASNYWSSRIKKAELENAVLYLSRSKFLNDAYSSWEFLTLKSKLKSVKNKKIVDIACGGGRVAIPLAKMGAKVTGVDISPDMLEYAKKYAKRSSCSSNLQLIQAKAWDIPLESNIYDKVLLLGILEHLPDKYKRLAIKEAKRILKKNGDIFVVINNKESLLVKQYQKWKKKSIQNDNGYYSSLMDPKNVINYLKSLNFKVSIINSNLNYSILSHLLNKINQKFTKKEVNDIYRLFDYFIDRDLEKPKYKNKDYRLDEKFADQYFLVAKKV